MAQLSGITNWRQLPPEAKQAFLERLVAGRAGRVSPAFKRKYRSDPVGFVHDVFNWSAGDGPTKYQDEILAALPAQKRVTVRGPHGLGKTSLAAWLILWFALTRDGEDWKVPTTASSWRQLSKYLWPEIAKWSRRLKWERVGRQMFDKRTELLTLNLKLATGEAFAVASDSYELIEGAHADQLLFVMDEAKAIKPELFDACEGALAGGGNAEAFALAISTPGEPQGRFYDMHSRKPGYEDWWVKRVSLQDAVDAGRISLEWAEQRKKQWGERSAVYQNRVEGEFCASDDDSVIPLAWVERANERWDEWKETKEYAPFTSVGVDVSRSANGDKTCLALRHDAVITELRRSTEVEVMSVTGQVAGILRKWGGEAVVDVIGIGAGVVDRLREQGFKVCPFNAAERSEAKDKSGELEFLNTRAAAWWQFRELLDPANNESVALPPDDELIGDLTAPHWKVTSAGKIQIESKDDIRKRLGRSTDSADPVVMAFYSEPGAAEVFVIRRRSFWR